MLRDLLPHVRWSCATRFSGRLSQCPCSSRCGEAGAVAEGSKPPTPRCGFDVFGAFSSLLRCSSDHDERVGFVDVGAGGRAVGSDGAAVLGVRVGRRAVVGDDGAAVLDHQVGDVGLGALRAVDELEVLRVEVGLVDAVPGAPATADAAGCVAVPKGTCRRCCGRTC